MARQWASRGDDQETNAMRSTGLLVIAAAALAAGAAFADTSPKTRTVCIDPAGKSLPAHCKVAQASRISEDVDICLCPAGADRVEASVCPKGVRAPAESLAYDQARKAAVKNGSLVGASFNGQPMCVAPRNALNP
jgi:hypothetical protein